MSGSLRVVGCLVLAALCTGCSDDPTKTDSTPPAPVTDLALVGTSDSSLTVSWTAPGNDGDVGQAALYDLRYSLVALPAGWDSATVVEGLAPPLQAGRAETVTVGGLAFETSYWLALQTQDGAGNMSGLSNVVEGETGDSTPPGRVTDLRAASLEPHAVTLAFTAPGDDEDRGQPATYELRYAAMEITDATWEAATVYPTDAKPQPAGATENIRVTGLTPEETIHFAVRAGDDAGLTGPVSNDLEVTLPSDTVPPAAITDLTVTAFTSRSATLTWTASGDDSLMDAATSYLIAHAQAQITEESWPGLSPVQYPGPPAPAGQTMTFILDGLSGRSHYYIALKAVDGVGNLSALSNIAHVITITDVIPPSPVVDLRATANSYSSVSLTWTAPGEDGNIGTATAYDVRHALTPITESSWPSAVRAPSPPTPKPPGQVQTMTVRHLAQQAEYFFALKTMDDGGNFSGLSNVVSATTDARPDTVDNVWVVKADGSGDVPTIQAAIDLASDYDQILVGPGVYIEPFAYGNKNLTVVSETGPETTILDGSSLSEGPMVTSGPGTTMEAVLDGFTIRGCSGSPGVRVYRGGLVFAHNIVTENSMVGLEIVGSTALVTECQFLRNDSWTDNQHGKGAALTIFSFWDNLQEVQGANVLVENSLFESNRAAFGPAVRIGSGNMTLRNNGFRDNWCGYDGGAIFMWTDLGQATIENNQFWDNEAGDHGGAIAAWHTYSGRSELRRNLFVRNTAYGLDAGGANGTGGALHIVGVSGVVENNTFVGNNGTIDCKGGAIGIELSPYGPAREWLVRRNIVVESTAGGIVCTREEGVITVEDNLLFDNPGCGSVACSPDLQSGNFVADPLFCDPANDDYRVRSDSPALTHPDGPIGAFATPGCSAPSRSQ